MLWKQRSFHVWWSLPLNANWLNLRCTCFIRLHCWAIPVVLVARKTKTRCTSFISYTAELCQLYWLLEEPKQCNQCIRKGQWLNILLLLKSHCCGGKNDIVSCCECLHCRLQAHCRVWKFELEQKKKCFYCWLFEFNFNKKCFGCLTKPKILAMGNIEFIALA